MSDSAVFDHEYARLNPSQKAAVDAIDGPVMVIAGPGTGKTQILAMRVANILRLTDTPASAVLALTFTENGAAHIRRRLVGFVGSRGYYVAISTFHGFCNRVIEEYPEMFEGALSGANASEADQIAILRRIIDVGSFERLAPFGNPYWRIRDIQKAIRDAKREGFSPDALERSVGDSRKRYEARDDKYHEKGPHKGKIRGEVQRQLSDIEVQEELCAMYRAYEAAMRERGWYDFEDMILEVIAALEKNPDFLLQLQERYHYVLVDEHQDTNAAQNRILELLTGFHDNPNIFVVGDDKQAIFHFQGANLQNFLYFKNKFPGGRVVLLEENYRSTQPILDAAGSVIEKNKETLSAVLRSARQDDARHPISVIEYPAESEEQEGVAQDIKRLIEEGVDPGEIALIYRDNKDAFEFARALSRRGVPYIIESDQDILRHMTVIKFLTLLSAIEHFGSDEHLVAALHLDFLDVDPLDLYALARESELRRVSFSRMAVSGDAAPTIAAAVGHLKRWKKLSSGEPVLEFLPRVMEESGLLSYVMGLDDAEGHLNALSALFDEAKKVASTRRAGVLRDFLEHIRILEEHEVPVRSPRRAAGSAVHCMTAHRAKGLEFAAVFVVGAYDGHWGNRRAHASLPLPFVSASETGESERNDDERRLFFMAMTRAKKHLSISYPLENSSGRALVPSQFIGEMRSDHLHRESRTVPGAARAALSAHRAPASSGDDRLTELIRERFLERGLAPTHLNNYLVCPWKYFYQNLLRVPSAPDRHQSYGIAAHRALELYFRGVQRGEEVGSEFLCAQFRATLVRQPLREKDFEDLLARGLKVLPLYFEEYHKTWNYNCKVEFPVSGIQLTPEIKLTGKIDKLELLPSAGQVVVVDYKTAKPKSRNEIEGKTALGTGDYKRQLVFYKILIDRYPERPYSMVRAEIDFVEPNERGKFKKEAFEIASEEVEELEAVIKSAAADIMSFGFRDRRCEEKDCPYCRLRDVMKSH